MILISLSIENNDAIADSCIDTKALTFKTKNHNPLGRNTDTSYIKLKELQRNVRTGFKSTKDPYPLQVRLLIFPTYYLDTFFHNMRFSQKAKVDIPVENSFKQKDKYTVRDLSLATGKESTAQESPVSKLRCQGDQYQRRHLLHTVTDGPTTHKNFDIYEKPVLNGFERLPRSPKYHCEPILQHDDTVRGNGDGKDEYDAGCDEGNWSTWYSGETVMQERAYG